MNLLKKSTIAIAACCLLVGAAFAQPPSAPQPKNGVLPASQASADFFDRSVAPILKASCFSCHSGTDPSGGLDLTTRAGLLKGGKSGSAISASQPEASLLLRAIHYDGRQMPPDGKLSAARIETLTKWIASGAVYSTTRPAATATTSAIHPPPVNAQTMRFWSFRPVRRPSIPKVTAASTGWISQPIDAFILAKLQAKGLHPAPPADRATLIRRAYYDLIGLPPTPDDVQAFISDRSPKAWETVVDRLLASPQYGERWGRHWLDLVRYAETNDFERDGDKPFVWRYRDYVIRSFNEDKPYDRFIREQLAGDEAALPTTGDEPSRDAARRDAIVATGYYRLVPWDDAPADPDQARFDELDDIVSTTSQTFLGLTVGCARCHDHKIDPIPQKDYYRFVSFLSNVKSYSPDSVRPLGTAEERRRSAADMATYHSQIEDLKQKIANTENLIVPLLSNVEREDFKNEQNQIPIVRKHIGGLLTSEQLSAYIALKGQLAHLAANPPAGGETALCVREFGSTAPPTHMLTRGNAHAPADEVQPAFLSVLAPPAPAIAPVDGGASCGRRLALANWIASPSNPLTARVMANRIWQFHFGRGIVRTASNFGFQGSAPTHPELLDYLASELTGNGWRIKPLHREILLSSAYRMSSQTNVKALAADPENNLFWRFDMRRLDAEEIRDSILAADGALNPKMYGPSVLVTLPREVLLGQSVPGSGWGESSPEEQRRRSIYVKVKRTLAVPMMAVFDGADMNNTCPVRFKTTQPTQALEMMNSDFVNQQAQVFAEFVRAQAGPAATPAQLVRFALLRVLQRQPSASEVERGVKLMADLQKSEGKTPDEALRYFCLVALNLDEFIYLS